MAKEKGGRKGRRRRRRDVSGAIVRDEVRKRITLAIGERTIKAPPSGPVKTPQTTGHATPVNKAVSIYAYPTKIPAQYKTRTHRIKINNEAAKSEKYRTKFDGEYVRSVATSQYRERDKGRTLPQYNIQH